MGLAEEARAGILDTLSPADEDDDDAVGPASSSATRVLSSRTIAGPADLQRRAVAFGRRFGVFGPSNGAWMCENGDEGVNAATP